MAPPHPSLQDEASIVHRSQYVIALLCLTPPIATADVLIDQIGPNDGSALAGDTYGSQSFLPVSELTADLAAIENMTLLDKSHLDAVEFVLDGWYRFDGPEHIVSWEVNIYSDFEAATTNLVGDILSHTAVPAFDLEWTGDGWLVRLPIDVLLSSGEYFFGVLMTNPYPDNGWAGVATSTLGDASAWQVAPEGEGIYVFAPSIETSDNLAYRVLGTQVPTPATLAVLLVANFRSRRRR